MSLPELGWTTWRLVLHTLSVRCCAAFVRAEVGRWVVVEACGMPSPPEQEGGVRLSLRYPMPSEVQELPSLGDWTDGEGLWDSGVGSDQLTVPLLTAPAVVEPSCTVLVTEYPCGQ
jgi:hypothetical protein